MDRFLPWTVHLMDGFRRRTIKNIKMWTEVDLMTIFQKVKIKQDRFEMNFQFWSSEFQNSRQFWALETDDDLVRIIHPGIKNKLCQPAYLWINVNSWRLLTPSKCMGRKRVLTVGFFSPKNFKMVFPIF